MKHHVECGWLLSVFVCNMFDDSEAKLND